MQNKSLISNCNGHCVGGSKSLITPFTERYARCMAWVTTLEVAQSPIFQAANLEKNVEVCMANIATQRRHQKDVTWNSTSTDWVCLKMGYTPKIT